MPRRLIRPANLAQAAVGILVCAGRFRDISGLLAFIATALTEQAIWINYRAS